MVEFGYHAEWYTLLIIDIIDWNDLEKFVKLEMLQYVKTWKNSISKFHFPVKLFEIRKDVIIQNCLPQKDLNTIENQKFKFLTIICEIRKKH